MMNPIRTWIPMTKLTEIDMHPMLKLLANNKHRGRFQSEITPGSSEATIYLYDMIVDSDIEAEYWGGVSPQAFIKELNALKASTIHLRVNSPGGSVFAARAMEQAIREHSAKIVAHIDGVAASAASFLIMAADHVEMAPGSFMMIHKAWTFAYGNSDDLLKTADMLDQIDGSLVSTYAAATGQPEDSIKSWMSDETWFDAIEAVKFGFADSVFEQSAQNQSQSSATRAEWDLSAYAHAPTIPSNPAVKDPAPVAGPVVDRDALARAAKVAILSA